MSETDPIMDRLEVVEGDITTLSVDAIVNAANETLMGGGGVDGAIHRAAGPELAAECAGLGGCATGEVKITGGYNLPAKFVIHAVGPVWSGGAAGEAQLLASCYRKAMELAADRGLSSIAFPAISTGVYQFPPERAARIAVATVIEAFETAAGDGAAAYSIERVLFCCFDAPSAEKHRAAIMRLTDIE